jgi:hypothetical protein
MVEKSPGTTPDLFVWPFVAGKMATEMALTASVSLKRAQRRESVRVE